ncbi:hypothetical protein GCWU000323_02445 [Leptotrichia hofstadii F0254]|uniref:Uncharacterized protein n=1 Tax=Leptotrichia hofstadii F0254 TaxID=634994 RepID=C9N0T0_9FUSO|nr:hypothetical protein GCWU000323_02445 [Leptotrichia hofstadii F0254]
MIFLSIYAVFCLFSNYLKNKRLYFRNTYFLISKNLCAFF